MQIIGQPGKELRVTLRPANLHDESFLLRLFVSVHGQEFASLAMDQQQRDALIRMQFDAQNTSYAQQFPQGDVQLILIENNPIGRFYVDRQKGQIRLVDISLLPEYRASGIGSALVKTLCDEAQDASKTIVLQVVATNPALGLYQRFGFEQIEDQGVYLIMEWKPHAG